MNRVDRLLEMLAVLQTQKVVTVDYLKQKFHISSRTVYRDMELLTRLRIQVQYKDDKGCFILNGYCLPVAGSKFKGQVSHSIMLIPDAVKNDVLALLADNNKLKGK
ncbi:MAG: HTH domain-containing protein [Mucilaginibacter sp.]|uniref:helix-turn-helix transcriptional regulator n=1 Tax=Mucilaginibacter sp. TaxID=1882438 RepID=UPI00319F1519